MVAPPHAPTLPPPLTQALTQTLTSIQVASVDLNKMSSNDNNNNNNSNDNLIEDVEPNLAGDELGGDKRFSFPKPTLIATPAVFMMFLMICR